MNFKTTDLQAAFDAQDVFKFLAAADAIANRINTFSDGGANKITIRDGKIMVQWIAQWKTTGPGVHDGLRDGGGCTVTGNPGSVLFRQSDLCDAD